MSAEAESSRIPWNKAVNCGPPSSIAPRPLPNTLLNGSGSPSRLVTKSAAAECRQNGKSPRSSPSPVESIKVASERLELQCFVILSCRQEFTC